jgi:Zn-dependent protease with chaperone function
MDFFEAQERAKSRTNRLVALFVLAVLGTIAAAYLAATLLLGQLGRGRDYGYDGQPAAPFLYWDPQLFGGIAGITVLIVGLASLFKWSQMRAGGTAVAEMVGGRRVNPQTTDLHERRLLNVVEEMAIASGTPVPAVYLLENEPGINAFAAGLTTSDAVVAVTRGAMEKLTRDELQGVVAHEFSHILNGDMRLNVKLSAIVFGILVIGLIGRGILYSLGRGRVRSGGGGKNKGGGVAAIVAVGIALLIIGYIGYFFGRLIQAAVSRQREFLADASAVQFTRNPAGIGGALKKIGGYALGSTMTDRRAAEIGHFFFAQGFRSNFGGLWATHPPLDQRIRAIEPRWDGKHFEPPTRVDVSRASFSSGAGFAPGAIRQAAAPAGEPASSRLPFVAPAITAQIGQLTENHHRAAQNLLTALPDGLRDAAHDPALAAALVFALLVTASPPETRPGQLDAIRRHAGEEDAAAATRLVADLAGLDPLARLPLLQLCLPTLRTFDTARLGRVVTALDEVVHADAQVSVFEFVLQKMLLHQLDQLKRPARRAEFHSFKPLAGDIAVVLSVLARTGGGDDARRTRHAFELGAAQLRLLDDLALEPASACTLERLDTALERLSLATLPIRQRLLVASAHVIGADGTVTVEEGELYRAVAAVLDCPSPPLSA